MAAVRRSVILRTVSFAPDQPLQFVIRRPSAIADVHPMALQCPIDRPPPRAAISRIGPGNKLIESHRVASGGMRHLRTWRSTRPTWGWGMATVKPPCTLPPGGRRRAIEPDHLILQRTKLLPFCECSQQLMSILSAGMGAATALSISLRVAASRPGGAFVQTASNMAGIEPKWGMSITSLYSASGVNFDGYWTSACRLRWILDFCVPPSKMAQKNAAFIEDGIEKPSIHRRRHFKYTGRAGDYSPLLVSAPVRTAPGGSAQNQPSARPFFLQDTTPIFSFARLTWSG